MNFFRWANIPGWWLPLMAALVMAMLAFVWFAGPGPIWQANRRATAIRQTGIAATAVVVARDDTGTRVRNDQFVLRLSLRVNPPDGAAYDATVQSPVSPLCFDDFAIGATIQVRIDPATRDVALDQRTD